MVRYSGYMSTTLQWQFFISLCTLHRYFDKTSSLTCVNYCSRNTLLVSSINTLTTSQNLSTIVPSKSKCKIKLSHKLNGSVPLTVYRQNVRGLRGKANELLSQICCSNAEVIRDSSQVPWNKSLKIFYQNIRGLGNKANELYCHLHHHLPHILYRNTTWVNLNYRWLI
jgi:hypothetical protein